MVDKHHEGSNGTDRRPPSGTDSHGAWHGGKGCLLYTSPSQRDS